MLTGMISSAPATVSGGGSVSDVYSDKGDNNFGIGQNLAFHADAENNIAIGENALNSTSGDADFNIGIGTNALTALTTGDHNVFIGKDAGLLFSQGLQSVAVGSLALSSANGTEHYNTAIGYSAMAGCDNNAAQYNVAIGWSALDGAITQAGTVAVGAKALGA